MSVFKFILHLAVFLFHYGKKKKKDKICRHFQTMQHENGNNIFTSMFLEKKQPCVVVTGKTITKLLLSYRTFGGNSEIAVMST